MTPEESNKLAHGNALGLFVMHIAAPKPCRGGTATTKLHPLLRPPFRASLIYAWPDI